MSAKQVSDYVGGVVTKTFDNMSIFMIWLGPLAIAFKEYKNDQAKVNAKLQIELEKLRRGILDEKNNGELGNNPIPINIHTGYPPDM